MNEWQKIPPAMRAGLVRFVAYGEAPGGFLYAVLCNELVEAFDRADSTNRQIVGSYVAWLLSEAPRVAWGNPQRVREWCEFDNRTAADIRRECYGEPGAERDRIVAAMIAAFDRSANAEAATAFEAMMLEGVDLDSLTVRA